MRLFISLLISILVAGCATSAVDQAYGNADPSPSTGARAEPAAPQVRPPILNGEVTYPALVKRMRENHPRLHAAMAAERAAEGRVVQAGLYPNPIAEAEAEEYDIGESRADGAEATLRITQPILWSGKRRDAVEAARAEVQVRRLEREQLELELTARLFDICQELVFLRRALALNDELTSFARQSLEIAQTRYELQAAPESDVSRSEVEVIELELERRSLHREAAEATARLSELIGGVRVQPDQIRETPALSIGEPNLAAARQWLTGEHPAIRAAGARVEAARARLEREQSARLPELAVTAGYGHSRAASNNTAEAAISIELPIFDRNQGAIASARAEIDEARRAADDLTNHLVAEFDAATERRQAAQDRQRIHARRVIPTAQRAHEQVSEGYRAGKLGFLELLDAQRTLTSARWQQLQLIREIRQADGQLFGLAGPAIYRFEKTK